MDLEFFFTRGENRFLFLDKESLHIGIGIKRFIPFEKLTQVDEFAFVCSHFFPSVKGDMWKNFRPGGYVAQEYYKIEKAVILRKKDDTNYPYHIVQEDREQYEKAFEKVQECISNGECEKIVLSRHIKIALAQNISLETLFYRALENNPQSYIFFFILNGECFFGASPELLIRKKGESISIDALAGTMKNEGENREKLLNCSKNSREHDIVVEEIFKEISPLCSTVQCLEREILPLKNLLHLHTPIVAHSKASIVAFLEKLHPTPALGGKPKKRAIEVIREVEGYERGCYGAPIGYLEGESGCFAVAIRSGLYSGSEITAFAGGGIVAGSALESEYKECENKLKTLLELFEANV